MSEPDSVDRLMPEAQMLLGHVDIVINNAGYSGSFQPFTQATGKQISQVGSSSMQRCPADAVLLAVM